MRYALLGAVALVALAGCCDCEKVHTGWRFEVLRPPSVVTSAPHVLSTTGDAYGAMALGSTPHALASGPPGVLTQGVAGFAPTMLTAPAAQTFALPRPALTLPSPSIDENMAPTPRGLVGPQKAPPSCEEICEIVRQVLKARGYDAVPRKMPSGQED